MASGFFSLIDEAWLTAQALRDFGDHLLHPTVRLGVTGLSRAGKTVFITSLVHSLLRGGRFPVFDALASGRIAKAELAPQPDDAVPRFDYETHLRALTTERCWPESTVDISELRLAIAYQSANGADRNLTLDLVDYPGEWLLDLPLLELAYEEWSAQTLARSQEGPRSRLAAAWHAHLATLQPIDRADEQDAIMAAQLFTEYLKACRDERFAMSLLPPGRFLLPGVMAGTPALTFAPLALPAGQEPRNGSLWAMMRRRFEAYKSAIVRPFFRDHFARLDRQVVLIDALAAFNAGPDALHDLETAMSAILDCFRVGRRTLLSALVRPRIERILFAATKADHLHQQSHDRLEAILKHMMRSAIDRAGVTGALTDAVAIAAVRATREAEVRRGRDRLPAIIGTPIAGETAGGEIFDGKTEVATFPGDLPADVDALLTGDGQFRGLSVTVPEQADFRFLRFRPPALVDEAAGPPALPHIRLDRAVQFLIGDRLK